MAGLQTHYGAPDAQLRLITLHRVSGAGYTAVVPTI